MKSIVLGFLMLSLCSLNVLAGQVNNATISTVAMDESGLVRITIEGGTEINPKAGCSSSANNDEYIYDMNSVAGKGWHAIVLSAQLTQKEIHIIGKNSCLALWGTNPYEAVKTLYMMK